MRNRRGNAELPFSGPVRQMTPCDRQRQEDLPHRGLEGLGRWLPGTYPPEEPPKFTQPWGCVTSRRLRHSLLHLLLLSLARQVAQAAGVWMRRSSYAGARRWSLSDHGCHRECAREPSLSIGAGRTNVWSGSATRVEPEDTPPSSTSHLPSGQDRRGYRLPHAGTRRGSQDDHRCLRGASESPPLSGGAFLTTTSWSGLDAVVAPVATATETP